MCGMRLTARVNSLYWRRFDMAVLTKFLDNVLYGAADLNNIPLFLGGADKFETK